MERDIYIECVIVMSLMRGLKMKGSLKMEGSEIAGTTIYQNHYQTL